MMSDHINYLDIENNTIYLGYVMQALLAIYIFKVSSIIFNI